MRKERIYFPDRQTFCVFPNERSELPQAIADLNLKDRYAVIVLIGGDIDERQAVVTLQAVQTITRIAEDLHAVVVCGGTNMGVMAEIGKIRQQKHYKFPLVGIAPEGLVAWPGGPYSTKFLWWGEKRWQLESHYSHFILVPGNQFGDESPWIVDAATALSKDHRSVTILINGGEISRKDIELSLEHGRPVIALSRTGRLADELASQPARNKLISIVPASSEQQIIEAVKKALSVNERTLLTHSLISN
jgi:hypothetical protein